MSTSTPPPPLSTPAADPAPALEHLPAAPAPVAVDLTDPLYKIEHVARVFFLEVDTARELTYRDDFPQPIKIGRRWLWFPDEVHAWARKQTRYSTSDRKRNAPPVVPAVSPPALKPHKPRGKKSTEAAA